MAELNITKQSVERAKEFILQYMIDSGYEGSLEDGTGVHDVLVKGYSLLYAMLQEQMEKTSGYLSLKNAQEVKSQLGAEYDDAVDAVLSNWFVERKEGTPTQGRLRLWFTRPVGFLQLFKDDEVFKFDGKFFAPQQEYIFTQDDFELVINKPQNAEEYFVDVSIISVENDKIIIEDGDQFTSYINNIYFIRGEALGDFETGASAESSEDFIDRTSHVITTRELISLSAFATVLPQEFPGVQSVYVAGHGDTEQLRDVVNFGDIEIHTGNKADIYIESPLNKISETYAVGGNNTVDLSGKGVATVLDVRRLNEERTSVEFSVGTDETLWLTAASPCEITVPDVSEGTEVEIIYLYSPDIFPVSDFITSPGQRVSCYDPLAKAKHPVVLSFMFASTRPQEYLTPLETEIKTIVQEYIRSLRHQDNYIESVLIEYLHSRLPALSGIKVPVNAEFLLFDEAVGRSVTGHCVSSFRVPEVGSLSKQISANTIQFYTDSSFITVR